MLIYNFFLYLIYPLVLVRLLIYTLRNSISVSYISQRFIKIGNIKKKSLWIHAASVGEMKIAIGLSRELLKNGYKDILITSNTPSSKYYFDNSQLTGVEHCYLPLDYYFLTKKIVNMISAKILIVIETEIWPNLFHLCKKNNTKVLIINGRFNAPKGILGLLSKRIYRETLDNLEHIYTKSKNDKENYQRFMNESKVSNIGNIKYSFLNHESSEKIIDRKYVLLASSHHREEIIIIKEWLKLKSNKYLLVIVPRHPERLGDILSDIPLSGINIAIRSKKEKVRNSTQLYIADTIGELESFIEHCEFTIFGGSFVDVGGHSFMEAAARSKTIVVGPYMYNFIEETEEFLKNNALIMCQKPVMLKNIFEKLFRSKAKREVFEKNAKKLVQEKSLIINNYLDIIDTHYKS